VNDAIARNMRKGRTMTNQEVNRVIAEKALVGNRRRCCFIDRITKLQCGGTAIWEIREVWPANVDPYDYTDSCGVHLGQLLTDAQILEIHRIDGSVPLEESDD